MRVKKTGRNNCRSSWRNLDYYVTLAPKQIEKEPIHPVDDILDALPHLRRKLANLRKCEKVAQPLVTDSNAFVNYADAQSDYRHARQIEAFNLGVELGAIVGRMRPHKASKARGAPPLRGAILGAALSATNASSGQLISLFGVADALLGGPADVGALKRAIEKCKAHRPKATKQRPT